jgi:putative ABC transport system substrate-binding protein
MLGIRRRDFVSLLGSAVAWPLAARAQQLPLIGVLGSASPGGFVEAIAAFRQGLAETGYVEGRNVAIEFRWAQNRYERLPELVEDLIRRRASVIVAMGAVRAPLAAKAATKTIPIVFFVGSDPIEFKLVNSLNHPGGNVTGVTTLGRELLAKRLQLLREIAPGVTSIGLLVNPTNPNTEPGVKELQALARDGGWTLQIVPVGPDRNFAAAFATMIQRGVGAWLHVTDAMFTDQREQLIALAARDALPGIFNDRRAVEAGGLMSYAANSAELYGLIGVYAGRILKGEKPGDLPVQQATKVELVINLKTAKVLGLDVPTGLLVRADEVIE